MVVEFVKEDDSDWTLSENRDFITPTCEITRQNSAPLYNYVTQSNSEDNMENSNIRWKAGAYDDDTWPYENNLENRRPANHQLHVDDEPDMNNSNCSNCERNASYSASGHTEWLTLFGNEVINSPFQDGHYIYRVVPGYGSGNTTIPPVLYVADIENPANFNAVLMP